MDCTSTKLEAGLAPEVRQPLTTVANTLTALMRSGHVAKGKRGRYGGAVMTTRCASNALIGCVTVRAKGILVGTGVEQIRSLPLEHATANVLDPGTSEEKARDAFHFITGLSLQTRFENFGDALDSIIDDLRSGAFEKWSCGGNVGITVEIESCSFVSIAIDRLILDRAAVFQFGQRFTSDIGVQQITRIHQGTLRRLAAALGPLNEVD